MWFCLNLISVMTKEINIVLTCIILSYIMPKYLTFKIKNQCFSNEKIQYLNNSRGFFACLVLAFKSHSNFSWEKFGTVFLKYFPFPHGISSTYQPVLTPFL